MVFVRRGQTGCTFFSLGGCQRNGSTRVCGEKGVRKNHLYEVSASKIQVPSTKFCEGFWDFVAVSSPTGPPFHELSTNSLGFYDHATSIPWWGPSPDRLTGRRQWSLERRSRSCGGWIPLLWIFLGAAFRSARAQAKAQSEVWGLGKRTKGEQLEASCLGVWRIYSPKSCGSFFLVTSDQCLLLL